MSQVQNFDVNPYTVVTGTGQTIGAVTADLITLDLGVAPGTYIFNIDVAGFDPTTPASVAYHISSCFRTTGLASVEVASQTTIDFEENTLLPCVIDIVQFANVAIIRVLGTAGVTIRWTAALTYLFRS
jgi:hypothetical protein